MKVSVLLITFNEASNLARCLSALSWCDDIVIVDSGSTDNTVEIARARNIRVLQRQFDSFSRQRNFGILEGELRYDWVLHLDADEVVTEEFVSRLLGLAPQEGIDAYFVPSKLVLFDRWLRYAGMYPVYQVRLGRADRLRFKQVGHGQREDLPAERIGVFDEPYLHFSFSNGLRRWLEKHVNYAAAEANELVNARRSHAGKLAFFWSRDKVMRRRAAKDISVWIPLILRPAFRFVYIYMFRRGFLDGTAGLCYAFMLAVYEANIAILAYELLKSGNEYDRR